MGWRPESSRHPIPRVRAEMRDRLRRKAVKSTRKRRSSTFLGTARDTPWFRTIPIRCSPTVSSVTPGPPQFFISLEHDQ
jgi:hypothetical protein